MQDYSSLGLSIGLYQFMSRTEGTALLYVSQWLLYPTLAWFFTHNHLPPHPPTIHPPLNTEKTIWKTRNI